VTSSTKQTTSSKGQVQSLVKALRLLEILASGSGGLSLKEISARSGFPASTTHRLLSTLQQERFARFDSDHLTWSVGVKTFSIGNSFVRDRDLIQTARPHMRALMETTGETVNLAIQSGDMAVYVAQVESRQMMRAMAAPGTRVPLHCSGVGKALLAVQSEQERAALLARTGMHKVTQKTITEMAAMRDALSETLRSGFAIDDEEHAVGLRCVASLIYDENCEAVGGLSVSGPLARIPDRKFQELGRLVCSTAERITTEFGGISPGKR
jgi:IclR family acetate operon transcriptional repressor